MALLTATLAIPTRTTQTYGDGEAWEIDAGTGETGGFGGVFDVNVKQFDTTRNLGDGDVTSPHYKQAQIITVPLVMIDAIDPEAAVDLVEMLMETWEPIESTAESDMGTLTILMWGRTFEFIGKPWGAKLKTGLLRAAYASALCSFKVYFPGGGS